MEYKPELINNLTEIEKYFCELRCWEYNNCNNKSNCSMTACPDALCWEQAGSIGYGDKSCLSFTSGLAKTCNQCNYYNLIQSVNTTIGLLKEIKEYISYAGVQAQMANNL